ncbi:MAG: SPOR domain-containing protein, partial [Desulfobacteraceae bacterium]
EQFSDEALSIDLKVSSRPSLAILPFENTTEEDGLDELVRQTLYSHLSPKSFRDLELAEVDRVLDVHKDSWKDTPAADLGRMLGADFLIYGKVSGFQKAFLGIYSQVSLTLEIDMVSALDGEKVWERTLTERSHDGGLPFSIFGVLPATLRSGLHMSSKHTVELVDRISRQLAEEAPSPSISDHEPGAVDIQVASFVERSRARETLDRLQKEGYRGRLEEVNLKGIIYHRVLLGPFENRAEAQSLRNHLARDTEFLPLVVPNSSSVDKPESPG